MEMWLPNMKFGCRFVFSRLPVRLQHRAVELADENSLGNFLFPTPETICSRETPVIPMDQLRDIKYVNKPVPSSWVGFVGVLRKKWCYL